jgi:DNA-binding protein H-NS
MASLKDIQEQIKQLQQQELELVNKEKDKVIAEIKEKLATYHITADDLGLKVVKKKSGTTKTTLAPKYKGPNGEEWHGGKGPRPKWVKTIEANGESVEKYLIQPAV